MQNSLIFFAFIIVFMFLSCDAYKVLVFSPTLSRSHMMSNARVADTLASDGHDVTLLEVEYAVPIGTYNASKIAKTMRVGGPIFNPYIAGKHFTKLIADNAFEEHSIVASFFQAKMFQERLNEACDEFVTTKMDQLAILKKQKFDVIISEQLNFCGAGIGHLLDIPVNLLLSSCPLQEHVTSLLGLPFPASYVPSLLDSNDSDKMSLLARFRNLLRQLSGYTYIHYGIDPLTHIFRKHFGNDFPDLRTIVSKSPFVFVAVDELVDFPRPIFPNVVYIGGLEVKEQAPKNAPLKEPFRSEMAKGVDGVIFFSMGSIMKSTEFPEAFRRHMFETFSQLSNYHFIVKTEKNDNFSIRLAEKLDNVFLTQWVPQMELLRHPRLRLFITHGGYNSLHESASAGVPLISMGFFADQYRNARVAERNGWALPFEKRNLLKGSAEFTEAILKVLGDPKYASNAKRTQKLLLTKPFTAKEKLTKSLRFLELNGGRLDELLSESRNLSTMELYNLDILLVAIVFLAASLLSFMFLTRLIWAMIIGRIFNAADALKKKVD